MLGPAALYWSGLSGPGPTLRAARILEATGPRDSDAPLPSRLSKPGDLIRSDRRERRDSDRGWGGEVWGGARSGLQRFCSVCAASCRPRAGSAVQAVRADMSAAYSL